MLKCTFFTVCISAVLADLRMASQPKHGWKTQQRNRWVPFQQTYAQYMEPSDFNYEGLKKQRDEKAYDNFLRSNIDNEQDRRNFNTELGEDHLPFRSFRTAGTDNGQSTVKHKLQPANPAAEAGVSQPGNYIKAVPGEPYTIPLRWNNPHSSELEVNIWIMNKGNLPFVIPIRLPSCSGEGYQDNVFSFTVPSNFNQVASCRNIGECVLQIYAHSVESRMYSMGTPLLVEGSVGTWTPGTIGDAPTDVAFDLKQLRRLCLPASDPRGDVATALVYKARLSSDVYNHAYQNSDFSPYAGQQPRFISQNLQASCILKMAVGNFGELGKHYMQKTAGEARQYAKKLDKKARSLIRVYETTTNSIINAIKDIVENTDTLPSVTAPVNAEMCPEHWKSHYNHHVGGKDRGKDVTGGYCPTGLTCLCHQDCYAGYGPKDASGEDAYCGKLIADGTEVPVRNTTTKQWIKNADGSRKMVASGKMKVEEASDLPRLQPKLQNTETCFRCAEVGSITTRRHNTNTYIPSFEIQGAEAVEKARQYVAPIQLKGGYLTHPDTGAITEKGDDRAIVQIYMAVLTDMWAEFKMASDGSYLEQYYEKRYNALPEPKAESLAKYKFTYRGPVLKATKNTLPDATQFRKIDAAGKGDKGYYASEMAWPLQARGTGSSTPVPTTAGPLNARLSRYTNMAGNEATTSQASGGGNTVYVLPPPESLVASCSHVAAALQTAAITVTEEGDDMDGLNVDADCDDDEYVAASNRAHDAECTRIQTEDNETYVCPPYPEPECHIEGQGSILPGQLFSNTDPEALTAAGGGGVEPVEEESSFGFGDFLLTVVIILLVVAFGLVLYCWKAKGVHPKDQAAMLKEKLGNRRQGRPSAAAQL